MINKRNKSMRLTTAIITLITVLTASFAFANTLGLADNGDGTWNVDYVSDGDISGFQFDVDGAIINNASGGEASDSGMLISFSETTVLAFSLGTPPIPEGEGVLIVLNLDGTPTGLSNIIVSDPFGDNMNFTYDSGDVAGCTDMYACNYNADATEDDGSCVYAEENYDCDGNCTAGHITTIIGKIHIISKGIGYNNITESCRCTIQIQNNQNTFTLRNGWCAK
jgi:hypothetical protein